MQSRSRATHESTLEVQGTCSKSRCNPPSYTWSEGMQSRRTATHQSTLGVTGMQSIKPATHDILGMKGMQSRTTATHQSTVGLNGMPCNLCVQWVHLSWTACRSSRVNWRALRTRPKVICMMLLCLLDAPTTQGTMIVNITFDVDFTQICDQYCVEVSTRH